MIVERHPATPVALAKLGDPAAPVGPLWRAAAARRGPRSGLGDQIIGEFGEDGVDVGSELSHAAAVRTMGIAVPGKQVLQSQLVDSEIVLGLDAVPLGLPVL